MSNRDFFVVLYLVKKININWAMWVRGCMVESLEDPKSTTSIPYRLLISRIIVDSLVDLSNYRPSLTDATYDTQTFPSMDYMLINEKLYRKECVQ